jgi:hypothetical protein
MKGLLIIAAIIGALLMWGIISVADLRMVVNHSADNLCDKWIETPPENSCTTHNSSLLYKTEKQFVNSDKYVFIDVRCADENGNGKYSLYEIQMVKNETIV